MRPSTRKWLVAAAVALLVGLPIALKLYRADARKEVEYQPVALRALTPSVLASGTLMYESEVKLVPEVIGRVTEVRVQEGDKVTQGQLLLSLDPATSQAEIAQLEAARRQSELNIERQRVTFETQDAKFKRYQALVADGVIDSNTYEEIASQRSLAQVELNSSQAMLRQTEAQLRQARERLAKTQIRSPIDGTVTAVYIKAGETAVPSATSIAGSDLMVIADTGSLHAEVNVDETDVARIALGQHAKIVPAAFPDKSWTGTVEQVAISPRQNPGQSKSYPVKIRLTATDALQFHPGMSCRAEISTRHEDAQKSLAVPVQAVKYEQVPQTEKTVAVLFVVDDGRARRREVQTGAADDAYIEIKGGVREREDVVTGPAKTLRFLRDGDRVQASLAQSLPSAADTSAASADSSAQ